MSVKIVNEYLTRKSIHAKTKHLDTKKLIQNLLPLVEYYGNDVFKINKSKLSARTINETIFNMLINDINDILHNLLKISKVRRNSFEHYQLIYGKNAGKIYNARTKKSLQTKENFIKRHGLEEGQRKWSEYRAKRSKQNSQEGFIERFGKEEGYVRWKKYIKRQAYTNTLEYYIEKYGQDLGENLFYKRYPKPEYNLKKFHDYKRAVYRQSEITYKNNIDKINPNRYPRTRMGVDGGWQLDHIKPVNNCFKEGMSIVEASDMSNLRMLPWKENLMRNFND